MVLMAVVGGDLKLLFVLLLQPVCMCVCGRECWALWLEVLKKVFRFSIVFRI